MLAAVIGVWLTLRILELQEDALRPYPIPSIDSYSRYSLTQLKVTNIGAGIAYETSIKWELHPTDEKGNEDTWLDNISVLLPKENISTALGRPWILFEGGKAYTFAGTVRYKDAKRRFRKHRFTCSGHSQSKLLLHDEELPKTLWGLQKIPEKLEKITGALEALRTETND